MVKRTLSLLISLSLLILLSSWGYQGHQKISGGVPLILPQEMAFLIPAWTDVVRLHASDADYRKNTDPDESPRHYIDIDNYPEFISSGRINHNLDSLIAAYGYSFVIDQGILPWATLKSYDSLVDCFQRKDWQKAGLFAADLGHYVGDGHMPMHLTRNYNGQYTGNDGVHSRYESQMINRYASQISVTEDSVVQISDVTEFIFNYIYGNYPYVNSILQADDYALFVAGNTSSDLYYETLWEATEPFTIDLFQLASTAISSLIHTAWVEAGKPVMDPNALPETQAVRTTRLYQNFPNPFQTITHIPIEVMEQNTRITLQIIDAAGVVLTTILDEKMASGYYEILWNSDGISNGIYYCILRTEDAVMTRKMIVIQ